MSSQQYKIDEGRQQYGVRKVKFDEPLHLADYETYNLLVYFTQILGIFDLEYSMLRNCSKASQVLELESKTQSGRPFWTSVEENLKSLENRQWKIHMAVDSLLENKTSYQVIQKLNERKKAWVDLAEDLHSVSNKMKKFET